MKKGNEMNNNLQEFLNNMSAEQVDEVKNASLMDWFKAVVNVVQEPNFWEDMKKAALEGVSEGVRNFEQNTDNF